MVENTFDRLTKRLNEKAEQKEIARKKNTKVQESKSKPVTSARSSTVKNKESSARTSQSNIKLPSGEKISVTQEYIEPSLCKIWEGNNRLDESRNDSSLEELKSAIEAHGQMVPGFVRPLKGDPDYKYEVIYGSRRFAACSDLDVPFLAQVGSISDKDALIMMDAENNARKELSVFEKAISYREWLKKGFFKDRADLAGHLGISVGWLSKIQSILKLPEEILSAFPRRTDISVWWAVGLLKIIKSGETAKNQILKAAVNKPSKIQEPEAIYKYLIKFDTEAKPSSTAKTTVKAEKFKIKNNDGKVVCDLIKGSDGRVKVVFAAGMKMEDVKTKLEELYMKETSWEF